MNGNHPDFSPSMGESVSRSDQARS
jgi:hypothetical protein